MTRKDKKRKKQRQRQEWQKRRWKQCARCLEIVGMGNGFWNLKDDVRNHLCKFCLQPPDIVASDLGPLGAHIREDVLERLVNGTINVSDKAVSWMDAYRVLYPLMTVLSKRGIPNGVAASDARFLDSAQRIAVGIADSIHKDIWRSLYSVLIHTISRESRVDRQLLWFRVDGDVVFGRQRQAHRITMLSERPERIEVSVDGLSRIAYRCGGCDSGKFLWTEWPGTVFGDGGHSASYPVYVQQHALQRLQERLKPFCPSCTHLSFLQSLRQPVLTYGRQHNTFMVEMRLANVGRVGYFVARRLCDKIVVTTFLFLTMQGTPEAEKLAASLRLRRPDIEYHGLDKLATFENSRLLERDPELGRAFEEAGCGDLLRLSGNSCERQSLDPVALRRYLCLGDLPENVTTVGEND